MHLKQKNKVNTMQADKTKNMANKQQELEKHKEELLLLIGGLFDEIDVLLLDNQEDIHRKKLEKIMAQVRKLEDIFLELYSFDINNLKQNMDIYKESKRIFNEINNEYDDIAKIKIRRNILKEIIMQNRK